MNLCESLSIRLFAVEQGLPSGSVPHRTRVTSEPQVYVYTKIRRCKDGSERGFSASDQSRKVMGGDAKAGCGVMNCGKQQRM
jgi:hypothetical protein